MSDSSAGTWEYAATGSSFFVSTTKVDQPTARTECQNMGGVLASITDEDEWNFVVGIS